MVSERIILGIIGLVMGLAAGTFSYLLRGVTKGAVKGWLYLSLTGASLFLWGLLWSLGNFIDNEQIKIIATGIVVPIVAFFAALGYTSFATEFGVKKPGWLSVRNIVIIIAVVYVIVGGYNYFFTDYSSIIYETGTVGLFVGGVAMIIAAVSSFLLFRGTGRYIWLMQVVYTLLVLVGLWSINYASLCCWEEGELTDHDACSSIDFEYQEIFNLPCAPGGVEFAGAVYNSIAVGLVIFAGSLGAFWWRLR
ncbi:MAG: hypothetical protein ACOCQX_03450 [Candidatus Nanoarchaeia archaeon]